MMSTQSPTLVEKLDKIRSPNLESQKQTAVVLEAVESTLKEQDTQSTPTGYFAALLALLNQTLLHPSPKLDSITSFVYLLDVVTPFAPQQLLRAKFTQILGLLAPVIQRQDAEASLLRPSLGCLESLLLAQDATAWQLSTAQIGPRRAVAALLNLSLDPRPKVRKRALEALRNVLARPPPSPTLDHPAADMCAETAMRSLQGLAEKAIKARKERHDDGAPHEPTLIHALQLVRSIASASAGWPAKKIEPLCELLLGIARDGNEHLTMTVFEIFEIIFESMAQAETSAKLPRLMEIITELRPAPSDTQLLPPWIAILSRGFDVSSQVEPDETFLKLPDVIDMMSHYLENPSKNIRVSAAECIISFAVNCVPDHVVTEASVYDEKALEKICKTAETLLSVRYQVAWPETFKILGALFDNLRWRAYPFLWNVVKIVGELRSIDSFSARKEADEVLGKAIRAIGPRLVLDILPLNLVQAVKGQPGRAWLLPLLRDFTSNTELSFFRTDLVPLSEVMFQKVLDHGDVAKTMEVKIFETIVQQVWATLPGFCDLPLDLTETFDQSFAEMLANLLYQQVNLRLDICRSLKALVESNQAIASISEPDDLVAQSRVTRSAAQRNLDHLGTYAGNLLAVLFNVYGQTLAHSRGPILLTINSFLSVTPPIELKETFDRVCQMLATELRESTFPARTESTAKSKETLPSTIHTLMDLVITMSTYLTRESFGTLFEIASLVVYKDDDPQLQKKAYKLIPRMAESETGRTALRERHQELQTLFLVSSDKVSAPARRDRLAALATLLPFVDDESLHFIPSILPEVVICCKEQNERARVAAFDLLVLMGQRMLAANGSIIDNKQVTHMSDEAPAVQASIEEYFTMVSAGLAGSTPHMISASTTAISRLLYEFHQQLSSDTLADLVQTMDLFLTSNNREIVRSVLGFVKVCVITLPITLVEPRLASLIQNLMVWSHEHKGHFRLKVKNILERMIRRFGFERVQRHCPEEDHKLIANIRKTKERSKRRKAEAKEDGLNDDTGAQEAQKSASRYASAFDETLYSSDEGSVDSDESDGEVLGRPKRDRQTGSNAYIVEDSEEPLDLLDRKVLGNISTTKPVKMRQPAKARPAVDMDGKLILEQTKHVDVDMDANDVDKDEDNGVGAYVAAIRGRNVPKRGQRGKLKWSNKRGVESDDEMEDDVETGPSKMRRDNNHTNRGTRGGSRTSFRGRGGGTRAGKGGIASGRRGLGEEKRKGPAMAGRVGKPRGGGGRPGGRR